MSYSEENGFVVLRMSREDYGRVQLLLGMGAERYGGGCGDQEYVFKLLDRLNEGNPNYTPYQVEAKKS